MVVLGGWVLLMSEVPLYLLHGEVGVRGYASVLQSTKAPIQRQNAARIPRTTPGLS